MSADWLRIACDELIRGVEEIPGPETNARIAHYQASVGLAPDDETPWCSAFANWCLRESGFKGTGKPNARSFLDWGVPCEPRVGAVVVLWRGSITSWQGHVAFLLGWSAASVYLLGGNQGNAVSVAGYSTQRVIGYRWRAEGAP